MIDDKTFTDFSSGMDIDALATWIGPTEAPELIHIADGLGTDPDTYISPKSESISFDSVGILLSQAVELLDSCITSTGNSPPQILDLVSLGCGEHELLLQAWRASRWWYLEAPGSDRPEI